MVGGLIAGGLVPKWYIWYICSLNSQNSTPLHQQNRRIFFSPPDQILDPLAISSVRNLNSFKWLSREDVFAFWT